MESLFAVLPFFNAGLAGAVFARFTGVNMSAAVLLILLYMGAKPVEAVSAMLMFNAFTYFTIYTQRHVMGIKDFVIFPGFKIMIPVLITIAAAVFSPFFGIVFFVAVFLAEIFAKMYQSMDVKDKPATASLAKMCGIAAVLALGGVALVRFMPEDGYYIFVGLVILGTAVLAWQGGDRVSGNGFGTDFSMAEPFLSVWLASSSQTGLERFSDRGGRSFSTCILLSSIRRL